jgi:hypothetical protein
MRIAKATRDGKHGNIPDELRQQAVKLLENYRVGQITKALRRAYTFKATKFCTNKQHKCTTLST